MSHLIRIRHTRTFNEYRQYYNPVFGAPGASRVDLQLVGTWTPGRLQRALMAMQRLERLGRTSSRLYEMARTAALSEIGHFVDDCIDFLEGEGLDSIDIHFG